VADRAAALRRLLAGDADDFGDLLRRDASGGTGTMIVRQKSDDQGLEIADRRPHGLGCHESFLPLGPTDPPPANTLVIDADLRGLLDVQAILSAHQDELRPLDEALLLGARPREPLQDRLLSL
jgi:hypothetical protein